MYFPATSFTVTDVGTGTQLAAGVAYDPAAGASVSYNGWTANLSGEPAAGDTINLEKTVTGPGSGANDNRNALAMQNLQTNPLVGGAQTIEGAYGDFVGGIGNQAREADAAAQAQASMYQETLQVQQSVSGVNMDEEAANLIRYQQAYQASGKALQIATQLFSVLLNIGN